MYKPNWIIGSLLVCALLVFASYFFLRPSLKDHLAYRTLLEQSNPKQKEETGAFAHHVRRDVTKEIVFHRNVPLRIFMTSEKSRLSLSLKNEVLKVVEHLENVHCLAQEEIYFLLPDGQEVIYCEDARLVIRGNNPQDPSNWIDPSSKDLRPMQHIRQICAAKAFFDYNTHLFSGEEVQFWEYHLPGHTLVWVEEGTSSCMEGSARTLEWTFKNGKLELHAHRMHGKWKLEHEIF